MSCVEVIIPSFKVTMTANKVLLLLVMLAAAIHAHENKCGVTQNTSLCSVSPGGSVYIQVMTNASGYQVLCKKQLPLGPIKVFTLKREKLTIQYEPFRNRTEFFINNGTFKISNVERNDSGHYIIEAFDPDGVLVRNVKVHLDVQEPLSSLLISVAAGVGALFLLILLICACCFVCLRKKKSESTI
ncbi:uncharacterized protein LOC131472952 isoform X2 [Solea solea]|uniref:uncharacterized protein LOC131472952 isoform X2 n=1 Tax=Solea solea TaxID=90069 RepID=UPI00272B9113|nr:uncharacterized protein LOC131472952 isoform X2 [Solea solea]